MLTIDQVAVKRDNQLIQFNLTVAQGDILLITGRSGCGKTTLLDAIGGYAKIESGKITWKNSRIEGLPAENRPVSTLFQTQNLFDHLNLSDNLRAALPNQSVNDLKKACADLGLTDHWDKKPGTLSGGQKQRAGLIAAVMRPEPIILLDEPFRELDPETRKICISWSLNQFNQTGKTTLLVSHHQEDELQIASQIPNLQKYAMT